MKNLYLALLICLSAVGISRAQPRLKIISQIDQKNIDLHAKFRNYQLSRLVTGGSFLSLVQTSPPTLEIPLHGGAPGVFELAEVKMLADDYVEIVAGPDGVLRSGRPSVKTFTGQQMNGPLTLTATIDHDFFSATVTNGDESWYIEQANGFTKCSSDLLVTYTQKDVVLNDSFKCGMEAIQDRTHELAKSGTQFRTMAGNCLQIRLAIATDAGMLAQYGSASAVRNYVLSIMNNVAALYRHEFVDNIEFSIVAFYSSQSIQTDPLYPNTVPSGTIPLAQFRAWAYANNGFGVPHHIGQLWTTRDIGADGWGELGIPTNGICNKPNAYHAIRDREEYVDATISKKLAHEIGHNLSAVHDDAEPVKGYIMTGGLTLANSWSATSKLAINNYLSMAAGSCISSCAATIIPAFEMKSAGGCIGNTVGFQDRSVNGTSDRLWEFEGGIPATSTVASPSVRYDAAGLFNVKLRNSNNTQTRQGTILISTQPKLMQSNCPLPQGSSGGGGIKMVGLNGTYIFTNEQDSIPRYVNRACRYVIGLEAGTNYDFAVRIGTRETTPQIREHVKIYIDYNNDGLFNEEDELVVKSPAAQGFGVLINAENSRAWLNFTTPATVIENTFLRMRVISDNVVPTTACHIPQTGQVKDYSAVFRTQTPLPVHLISFKAYLQEKYAKLEWETATETNSDRFEAEYSKDLKNWQSAGILSAATASTEPVRYELIDPTPHSGVIYYRLKMIDRGGTYAYSKIQSVKFAGSGITIYPNPASDYVFITDLVNPSKPLSEIEEISITNAVGQMTRRQKPDSSQNRIGLNNPAPGIYIVSITFKDQTVSRHKITIAR